jgi:hypothetical protein
MGSEVSVGGTCTVSSAVDGKTVGCRIGNVSVGDVQAESTRITDAKPCDLRKFLK